MIIKELLSYAEVTLMAFIVNIVPAFAPPTWIVLSLYKIQYPGMSSLALAFFGVLGSVIGRFVMYHYSRVIGKHVPQRYADNLKYFRKFIEGKKLGLFLGTFIYSLSPFPSNFLFMASGISGISVLPLVVGFALGRFVSYASLIYVTYETFGYFHGFGAGNMKLLADLFGIVASILIIFVDWKKMYEKTEKTKEKVDNSGGPAGSRTRDPDPAEFSNQRPGGFRVPLKARCSTFSGLRSIGVRLSYGPAVETTLQAVDKVFLADFLVASSAARRIGRSINHSIFEIGNSGMTA